MAKEIPDLVAEARAGTGKGAARQARREGKVPGIVYGDHKEPVAVAFDFNNLLTKLRAGRFMSTLWNLKVDGRDDVRVICRAVQKDVVKDLPIHIDFMRLRRTSKVNLFIPVEFIGQENCPGLRKGGTLVTVRPEVELVVTAGDIPDHITVDLSNHEVGDSIHIDEVDLPAGAKPTIDRNFVIANIAAPSALRSSDDEADNADEAAEAEEATEE
ncbi:50S ribosomal protein L25/general stress protein Ctc [Paracoccus sp. R12_1]|uniref:50S ribosomal protein L25/general stress protein Ctc n=1 Tax=unclassified Paracoccus (in: a-proteobacteria) TaxID=2688777 RepID=UPI001ADB4A8B|nr:MULTISPECIES: 50S ribosomal protein L25/general stress protein Ctc [unclassified Paracoccus (in: a-proteobacteria)]MBO9454346.1 50S ribosomal protein L25/general stress protein Ctc [Paracoccus sp. R12_2]MBO9485132.1 50S ribosomal protein L25/general stress protein Ctc [Paracoccus sp. R12_1]